MTSNWNEWLHLAVRWLHVMAGVFWLGQTAYFTWLDRRFSVEARPGERDEVWMVHSGGFYVVEKRVGPELLPRPLHWFKWEAALTWASGMFLLAIVYYLGGALVAPDSALSVGAATALGLGVLVAGWLAYDLIWLSPLGRREALATAVCLALLLAAAYGLTRVLSGRAAYLHVGALLGTIMTANVWQRILPGQRRMIAAVRAGEKPDLALAARAKQRSKHNTFMALPVVFLMVSPHFPTTSYGHRWNWLLLLGFVLVGFAARWALNRWEGRREEEARPAGSPAFAPAAALAPVQAGAAPVAERSAGATAEALQRLNHSPIGQAVEELLACCGCRQWAEAVAGARPYEDAEDLLRAADGAFDRMDRDGWLEAFAAHPAIGESRAQGEQGAAARAWSAAEQAGTRAADRDTLAELAAANREYEARFGHVFLICAAGKSAAEMLAALSERLAHDPEREFDLAADEQRKITRLRFSKLLERLAGGATAAGAGEGRMRAERAAGGQGEG